MRPVLPGSAHRFAIFRQPPCFTGRGAGEGRLLIRPPLSWLMRRSGRARGGSSFGCGKAIGRAGACG
jgi:hypothetical protein